ncbi:MAG: coatomer subunit epsilon [Terracidiphilus sp.]
MDTQTRHSLKKNSFAAATASSVSWVSGHRSGVLRWIIVAVVVLVAGVASLVVWSQRSNAAGIALGAALDTYSAQLAQPGAPTAPDEYATASDRAKAANQQFVAVAQKYGWLPEGAKAHYFAGVTYQQMGQNAAAESEFKAAAGVWDRNLSNLAKLALAALYHQTNRDHEAIDLYNAVAAKPSETVSKAVAQLDLADLYAATGQTDQARKLWAAVKDADKDGMAGSIAQQKLGAKN